MVGVYRAVLGIALAAAITPQLRAGEVVLQIHRHEKGALAGSGGTVTAQSVIDPSRSLAFTLPAAAISLPPGDWFLSAHIADDWSEPQLVTVREATQTAELDTFPQARIAALVTIDGGKEPRELRAYFQRVSLEDLDSPKEGNVLCDVAKGKAMCRLPAGEFDLAFRIPGYVSRYLWNAKLAPRSTLDAGALHFVTGSTLSGRIEVPPGSETPLDRVTVMARISTVAGANEEQRHRNEATGMKTHPTRRGFFAFDLPPGAFTIQASYKTLISEELNVSVTPGREVPLRQPLRLKPQRSVTVRVHPPLNPLSKPWTIELNRMDDTGVQLAERALSSSKDGSCRFDNVLPGRHVLNVVRAPGQSWASQMIDVDQDAVIDVDVKIIRFTGRIRLGTKPISAMALLRSPEKGAAAVIKSKQDGTFSALLPAPEHDTWDEIEVRADLPLLKRTLQNVRFQTHDDGTAELNIDFPARNISGTVVDEIGRPATQAIIDMIQPDGSLQQIDSPDGSFLVTGLESGRHRLRAATTERESIDVQDVTVSEDKDTTADVVLIVVPIEHLKGVIRSLQGPVIGAALFATRARDLTRPFFMSRVDQEGHFDIRFPAATSEVVVAINAPGFAFRLATASVSREEQTFGVEQNGGRLSVDTSLAQPPLRPYLMHNGAVLLATTAVYAAGGMFEANVSKRLKFVIPSIEPGAYSICWLADEPSAVPIGAPPCISGVLAPHGTLTLAE